MRCVLVVRWWMEADAWSGGDGQAVRRTCCGGLETRHTRLHFSPSWLQPNSQQ